MLEKGRIIADETPAELIKRFGRSQSRGGVSRHRAPRRRRRRGRAGGHHERRAPASPLALAVARADDACRLGWAHLRHGAALLVRDPLLLAAHRRADLLAAGADADVGLPAELPRPDDQLRRQGRRAVHRRRAAVGHPGAQPARVRGGVPGGDLVAQPRPPHDEPAAARRVHRRADDRQPHQADGGDGAGGAAGLPLLRLQRAEPRLSPSPRSLPTSSS